jgi:hypothetical protein
MLPDGRATCCLELLDRLAAASNQVGSFLVRKVRNILVQPVDAPLTPHDAMRGKHLPRHPLDDYLIVIKLAFVVREDCRCDVSDASRAAVPEQGFQHDWLVDMGHPHLLANEVAKTGESGWHIRGCGECCPLDFQVSG